MITPLVSLIIINFNGFEITKKCLESIFRTTGNNNTAIKQYSDNGKFLTKPLSYEIIVVDNASSDNSVAGLKKMFSSKTNFHIVSRKTNDFLAAACNEGFSYSQGNIVIFMNNDLSFTSGWLEEIVNAFSQKKVGLVGTVVLQAKEKGRIDNIGGCLNFLGYGTSTLRGKIYPVGQKITEPFYIPGMLVAVRRSLFIKAGKFDESYGANYEDVDLAWRIKLLGYKASVAKRAIVYHLGSWTVNKHLKKSVSSYLCRRNRLTTILKNAGAVHLLLALPLYLSLQLIVFLKELILDKNIHLALTTPKAICYNFANLKLILAKRKKLKP